MSPRDHPNKVKAMEGVYLKKMDRANPSIQTTPKPMTSSRATGAASLPPGQMRAARDSSNSQMRRSQHDSFGKKLRSNNSP